MRIPKNLSSMLVGGALAGFLSGLILPFPLGLRGAIFGCGLSLALHLIQKFGWQRSYAYLPGLVIGVLLGLFPFELNLYQEPLPYRYDYFTLINSFITIPLFSCAFLTGTWKKRSFLLLLFGLISCILRSYAFERSAWAFQNVILNFPIGMLPFLLLWTGAMQLTFPRTNQ